MEAESIEGDGFDECVDVSMRRFEEVKDAAVAQVVAAQCGNDESDLCAAGA